MKKLTDYVMINYSLQERKDIMAYGCVSGCANGLVTYSETNAFHDEYEDEIWDLLYQDAENENRTIMELIASFYGQKNVESMEQFKNLLVWYAVKKICWEITRSEEE